MGGKWVVCLDKTNTSISCSNQLNKSIDDPYEVKILLIIGLIFLIVFVCFLVKIMKKAFKNRDGPNPLAYNVAMSNQLMKVSTYLVN